MYESDIHHVLSCHPQVKDTLELLGLVAAFDTLVQELSGGEKKRLSIALELLTNPPIMFFDEPTRLNLEEVNLHLRGGKGKNHLGKNPPPVHPTKIRTSISPSSAVELNTTSACTMVETSKVSDVYVHESCLCFCFSGLDSSSSVQVMNHLKSLANGGHTVVCVIHQPSSRLFQMFDDVLVLSEGRSLYCGPIHKMVAVFEAAGFSCPNYYNRSDFAIEVACRERGNALDLLVDNNKQDYLFNFNKTYLINYKGVGDNCENLGDEQTAMLPCQRIEVPRSQYPVSIFYQFYILFKRSLICTLRDSHMAQNCPPELPVDLLFVCVASTWLRTALSHTCTCCLLVLPADGSELPSHTRGPVVCLCCQHMAQNCPPELPSHTRGCSLFNMAQNCPPELPPHTRGPVVCLCCQHMAQIRPVAHVVVALMLGAVYYNIGNDAAKVSSNTACLFFFIMFLFFANAMPTVQTFPLERAVFLREHLNNWYSLGAYYLAKMVADIPLQVNWILITLSAVTWYKELGFRWTGSLTIREVLCPTVFLLSGYFLTGQPCDLFRLLLMWAMCLLLTITGQTLGLVAGAAFDSQVSLHLFFSFVRKQHTNTDIFHTTYKINYLNLYE
uniref:ABC transporter domain-containing protein n=1 Tax=Timema cristinae TaxID=61476 RepID=A0A7R9H217_TIMCR|nr:unnamed protein product [Timema cristinae]